MSDDPEKTLHEVAPHTDYQLNQYAKWQAHEKVGVQEMDLDTFKKSGMTKVLTPDEAIAYLRTNPAGAH